MQYFMFFIKKYLFFLSLIKNIWNNHAMPYIFLIV